MLRYTVWAHHRDMLDTPVMMPLGERHVLRKHHHRSTRATEETAPMCCEATTDLRRAPLPAPVSRTRGAGRQRWAQAGRQRRAQGGAGTRRDGAGQVPLQGPGRGPVQGPQGAPPPQHRQQHHHQPQQHHRLPPIPAARPSATASRADRGNPPQPQQ